MVYEAPLLRGLTNHTNVLTVVSGSEVRASLSLSRSEFVDFALLLGTDFSQRIKNVGPARALKFIRGHGCIEEVLEKETKYTGGKEEMGEAYMEQVEVARKVFGTLPPVPERVELEQGEVNRQAVTEILQRHGLHKAVRCSWEHETALQGNYFQDNPNVSSGY